MINVNKSYSDMMFMLNAAKNSEEMKNANQFDANNQQTSYSDVNQPDSIFRDLLFGTLADSSKTVTTGKMQNAIVQEPRNSERISYAAKRSTVEERRENAGSNRGFQKKTSEAIDKRDVSGNEKKYRTNRDNAPGKTGARKQKADMSKENVLQQDALDQDADMLTDTAVLLQLMISEFGLENVGAEELTMKQATNETESEMEALVNIGDSGLPRQRSSDLAGKADFITKTNELNISEDVLGKLNALLKNKEKTRNTKNQEIDPKTVAELSELIESITGEVKDIEVQNFGAEMKKIVDALKAQSAVKDLANEVDTNLNPEIHLIGIKQNQGAENKQNQEGQRIENAGAADGQPQISENIVAAAGQVFGSGINQNDTEQHQNNTLNTAIKAVSLDSAGNKQVVPSTGDAAGFSDALNAAKQNTPFGASSSGKLSASTELQADRFEFINELGKSAKVILNGDKSEMMMQLKPESLGKVLLKVVTENGIVNAKFVVENEAAKQSLEANLQELKETLSAQGLFVQDCMVQVGQENARREEQNIDFGSRQNRKGTLGKQAEIGVTTVDGNKKAFLRNQYYFEESSVHYSA